MGWRPEAGHPLPIRYADSHSDQDLQCFHTEIDVVLSDMQARRELDSQRHSYSIIAEGFSRGRNRPEDIPAAINFYHMAGWE